MVRVELQLRRKFLRSRVVSSVEELVAGAANVFGYLYGEWFRLGGPASGRFHKRETLPEWAAVKAALVSSEWSDAVPWWGEGDAGAERRAGGALCAVLRGYVLDGCGYLSDGW